MVQQLLQPEKETDLWTIAEKYRSIYGICQKKENLKIVTVNHALLHVREKRLVHNWKNSRFSKLLIMCVFFFYYQYL